MAILAADCLAQETNAVPQAAAEEKETNQESEAHPSDKTLDEIGAVIVEVNDIVNRAIDVRLG